MYLRVAPLWWILLPCCGWTDLHSIFFCDGYFSEDQRRLTPDNLSSPGSAHAALQLPVAIA
jgi:hypothetical protein